MASQFKQRDSLTEQMGAATFWDNPDKAQKTIQALKPLNAILKPYEELTATIGDLQTMAEMAADDPELGQELATTLPQTEAKFDAFELQSMLSGKADANNAFLRIQAGTGGTDACDWAEILLRMYTRWSEDKGFKVEIQDMLKNEEAGIQSAVLKISGDYAYGFLQSEQGVHRLVRISPFGSGDTRQTSFAAVDVTPELDDSIEIELDPNDIIKQTFSAGGPGGQHQNKTQSGVRLIHISGVRAESRTERSQHKNHDNCLKMLKARLYAIEEQKRLSEVEKAYDEKGEIAWGNQIRSYVMQPYTLVRDERSDLKVTAIQGVLDGDLEPFIQAYLRRKALKLHKGK